MNHILSLSFEDFIALVIKAFSEREKDKAWAMWLTLYPHMSKDTFIPFSEFYQDQTVEEPENKRSTVEILAEAEGIRAKIKPRPQNP